MAKEIDYKKLYFGMCNEVEKLQNERANWLDQLEIKQLIEEFERTKKKYGFHVVKINFEDGNSLQVVYSGVDGDAFNKTNFDSAVTSVEVVA